MENELLILFSSPITLYTILGQHQSAQIICSSQHTKVGQSRTYLTTNRSGKEVWTSHTSCEYHRCLLLSRKETEVIFWSCYLCCYLRCHLFLWWKISCLPARFGWVDAIHPIGKCLQHALWRPTKGLNAKGPNPRSTVKYRTQKWNSAMLYESRSIIKKPTSGPKNGTFSIL